MADPVDTSAEAVDRAANWLELHWVTPSIPSLLRALAAERDRLQAERDRLRQEAAWRPINTAPRDKTYILLGHHGENHHGQNNDFASWAAIGFYRAPDPWRRKWWILERDGFHPQNSRFEPTHWLPLPQPPAKDKPDE